MGYDVCCEWFASVIGRGELRQSQSACARARPGISNSNAPERECHGEGRNWRLREREMAAASRCGEERGCG